MKYMEEFSDRVCDGEHKNGYLRTFSALIHIKRKVDTDE